MVSSAAKAAQGLQGTTTVTFVVANLAGGPLQGITANFAELAGEHLVTLGAASAASGADGLVSVSVTGKTQPGIAHVVTSLSRTNRDGEVSGTVSCIRAPRDPAWPP